MAMSCRDEFRTPESSSQFLFRTHGKIKKRIIVLRKEHAPCSNCYKCKYTEPRSEKIKGRNSAHRLCNYRIMAKAHEPRAWVCEGQAYYLDSEEGSDLCKKQLRVDSPAAECLLRSGWRWWTRNSPWPRRVASGSRATRRPRATPDSRRSLRRTLPAAPAPSAPRDAVDRQPS